MDAANKVAAVYIALHIVLAATLAYSCQSNFTLRKQNAELSSANAALTREVAVTHKAAILQSKARAKAKDALNSCLRGFGLDMPDGSIVDCNPTTRGNI